MIDFADNVQTRNTIRHEFGHWVTAKTLGFGVGPVVLLGRPAGDDGAAHVDLFPQFVDIAGLVSYLERRIVILYAGVAGECLTHTKVHPTTFIHLLKSSATNDFAKIRELLRVLTAAKYSLNDVGKFQKKLNVEEERCAWNAIKIVQHRRTLIQELTSDYYEKARKAKGSAFILKKFEMPASEIEKFPGVLELAGSWDLGRQAPV